MVRSKMGIPITFLGAAIYFASLFGGYYVAILMAGYVLLVEEDYWLRRMAVKAVATLILFSVIILFINFIPDVISIINNFVLAFDGSFRAEGLNHIISAVVGIIDFVKCIVFLNLGFKALRQTTVAVPIVDSMLNRYMS